MLLTMPPALLLTLTLSAGAQAPPSPEPVAPAQPGWSPTYAVRAGGPLLGSVSAGVIRGRRREQPDACPSVGGWLLRGEAGVGGGRVDVGPAFTYCYSRFGALAGAALTGSLVRTWGRPLGAEANRTYAGPSLTLGAADWSLGLGVVWRIDAGEDGDTLFTWSVGRGF
jgi:hypothetical protein